MQSRLQLAIGLFAAGLIFLLFGLLAVYPIVFLPSLLVRRDGPMPPRG